MLRVTISTLVIMFLLIAVVCQEPKSEPAPIKERVIYVPYHQLDNLVPGDDTGVYLSYKEYRELLEELEKLKHRPMDLPVSAVLSDIRYQGIVKDNFIEVQAIGNLNVLKAGWHSLSLDFANIAIKEAMLDQEPALLKWKSQGYELLFESQKAEKRQFKLTFMVPVQKDQQLNAVVQFRVPRSPIAELMLEIPALEGQDPVHIKAQVDPSLAVVTTTNEEKKSAQLQAMLGNTDQVKITWQSQIEHKVDIKNVLHAENLTRLEIGENFLQLNMRVRYDLIQGDVTTLKFKLPIGFRVLTVTPIQGGTLQPWNQDENSRDFEVMLNQKMVSQGDDKPDFELEMKLEKIFKEMETKFILPSVEILGIEREKGFYTISINDVHKLNIVERKDITPIDLPDLPNYVSRQGIEKAFKYLKLPYSISVELEKKEPEYNVVTYVYANISETEYNLTTCLSYNITQSRIFGTKIEIPIGFKLERAVGYDLTKESAPPTKGYPTKPGSVQPDLIKEYREVEDQGKKFLNIVFNKGIRSSNLLIRLEMKKSFGFDGKESSMSLPVFQVQEAKSEIGNIGISIKPSFSMTTIDKSQKNITPMDVKELFKRDDISPYKGSNLPPINIGLQYSTHPIAAEFKIEKRDPFVTAEVYNYVDVAENLLTHRFVIRYRIEYTGVKEFSFTLPKDIADQVPESRITEPQGNNLKKDAQLTYDEATKLTTYLVPMQREVLGNYELQIVYEKKLDPTQKEQTHTIFELKTTKTNRETGFIVFKKNNNLSVDFFGKEKESKPSGLEVSDVNDPQYRGEKEGVLAIYKYNSPGYQLVLWMKKLSFEPVLNTIIRELHISSTVNKDLTCKNEALIVLMNNRNQMLEFCIPENNKITAIYRAKTVLPSYRPRAEEMSRYFDSLLWSEYDNPDAMPGWQYFKVNIASNAQKDAPFVLLISYEGTLTSKNVSKEMKTSGNMKITSIRFVSVPVLYFSWELGLPSEYHYTAFESNLAYNPKQLCRGFWAFVTKAMYNLHTVEATPIDQDAATGLIPSYPVSGTRFYFHRMNGNGYINISYIYNYWYNGIHTLTMIFILGFIFGLALFRFRVIHAVFGLCALSFFMASINLQGYQNLWCTVFVTTLIAGLTVWMARLIFGWAGGISAITGSPKPSQLYRDKVPGEQNKNSSENVAPKTENSSTSTPKIDNQKPSNDANNH